MKKRAGIILIVIGVLHSLLGLVKYSDHFLSMAKSGLINSAQTTSDKLAFWFTFAGLLFTGLGYLVNNQTRQGVKTPRAFGWMIIGASAAGIVFLPVSGFWLVFLPGILILSDASSE